MKERSGRWWNELSTHRRSWSRPDELATAVHMVTQAQVIAFSEQLVFNASSVSSWIVPFSVNPGAMLLFRGKAFFVTLLLLQHFCSIFHSRSLACRILGGTFRIEAIDCVVLRGLICSAAMFMPRSASKFFDREISYSKKKYKPRDLYSKLEQIEQRKNCASKFRISLPFDRGLNRRAALT